MEMHVFDGLTDILMSPQILKIATFAACFQVLITFINKKNYSWQKSR